MVQITQYFLVNSQKRQKRLKPTRDLKLIFYRLHMILIGLFLFQVSASGDH